MRSYARRLHLGPRSWYVLETRPEAPSLQGAEPARHPAPKSPDLSDGDSLLHMHVLAGEQSRIRGF